MTPEEEAAILLAEAGPCTPEHKAEGDEFLPRRFICMACAEVAVAARLRERDEKIEHNRKALETMTVAAQAFRERILGLEEERAFFQRGRAEDCERIAALEKLVNEATYQLDCWEKVATQNQAENERLRQRDEKLKRIVMDSGNDSTFMEAYSGIELQGEQCPVCHFPCDTRYATIMAIGDGKVAHLLCAYSMMRERIAALEELLSKADTMCALYDRDATGLKDSRVKVWRAQINASLAGRKP